MAGVSINVSGFDKLDINLDKFTKEVMDATMSQLFDVAVEIMSNSQEQVPVDTASLQNSDFITVRDESIIMGYGGPYSKINPKNGMSTEEYALKVHEDLSMPHVSGKAKFLEDPFNDACYRLDELLVGPLKSQLSR